MASFTLSLDISSICMECGLERHIPEPNDGDELVLGGDQTFIVETAEPCPACQSTRVKLTYDING